MGTPRRGEDEVRFGPFVMLPARKLLLREGSPVRLGQRAMDILVLLVGRAGNVVSKAEMLDQVWPGLHVEETNLRAQISALRKALNDRDTPARFIMNVAGRGYSFVAPVQREGPAMAPIGLPGRINPVIGRDGEIQAILQQVTARRFVTIVGAGGIGKTTVALAVARHLAEGGGHAACFVDLSMLRQDTGAVEMIAAALNLAPRFSSDAGALAGALQDRSMLLLLDCCETVIDAAALIAETILAVAPKVHILATSREPLRAEGEWIWRLPSFETPADAGQLGAAQAMALPAIRLFAERAAAAENRFTLSDPDVPLVVDICRRLEGIPLAIEFAAGQLHPLGLNELAARLDARFSLLMKGRRTALPRHQTLRATLDWSYGLLSEMERAVLCRMSVFRGGFTRAAALAVAPAVLEPPQTDELLSALLDKSMLMMEGEQSALMYRCPDTTRAYLSDKLAETGEHCDAERLHGAYFLQLLEAANAADGHQIPDEIRGFMARHMGNVHAALDWAFGPRGDLEIGLGLALSALPLWSHFSLVEEGRRHLKAGLAALGPGAAREPKSGMRMFAALGSLSLLVASEEQEAAWRSCLALAEQLDDLDFKLRALSGLVICTQIRDVREGLEYARRYRVIAADAGLQFEVGRGERIIANLLHVMGEQEEARSEVEVVLARYAGRPNRRAVEGFHFDDEVMAKCTHAAVLWLQGFPEQALYAANAAVKLARELDHEQSLFYAAAYCACPIGLFCGSLDLVPQARDLMAGPLSSDPPKALWNSCYTGIETARRGSVGQGLALVRRGLRGMAPGSFGIRHPVLRMGLGECLMAAGRADDAVVELDAGLDAVRLRNDLWCEPELVRLRGVALLAADAPDAQLLSEREFRHAIALAQRQSAVTWELRAATSLAGLMTRTGQAEAARDTLSPVIAGFTEGFDMPDLVAARAMMRAINGHP